MPRNDALCLRNAFFIKGCPDNMTSAGQNVKAEVKMKFPENPPKLKKLLDQVRDEIAGRLTGNVSI